MKRNSNLTENFRIFMDTTKKQKHNMSPKSKEKKSHQSQLIIFI